MKKSKQILSFILSVIMLFSVLAIGNISSAAEYYEQEDNNTANRANTIPLNSTMSGIATNGLDADWFKFTLSKNSKVDISFAHDYYTPAYNDYSPYWDIYLYKDTGDETQSKYDRISVNFTGGTGRFPTYGLRPGTYYIEVNARNANNAKYYIDIECTETESWEKERNNTAHDSNAIKLNFSMSGISTNGLDADWYKFTISKNSKVDISFAHEYYTPAYNDYRPYWDIYLYKDTGNETQSEYDRISVNFTGGTGRFPTYGLRPGTYYIEVIARNANNAKYTLKVSTPVDKPSSFKVSSYTSTSVKLKWSSVSGATGYQLQRKVDGKYKSVKTTSSTSYNVTELPKAKNQTFRVRAYINSNGTKIYSSWVYLTVSTAPSIPGISTLSTSSSHKITADWKKVSSASGYQIKISTTKDFKKYTVASVGYSKSSKTFSNLTKGKTYYVKVRSFRTAGDKNYYSDWSSVKNIKCK